MKFYCVPIRNEDQNSGGYNWFTNKREAEAEHKAHGLYDIQVVDIKPTKAGILRALNIHASHPDNG